MAEKLCSEVTWNGDEGAGSLFGHAGTLVSTDAGLFVNLRTLLTTKQLHALSALASALGAVVVDADSAEMVSGNFDL